MNFENNTISYLREKLDKKELSAKEVALHYLEKIEADDHSIDAFITVTREKALCDAEKAQSMIDSGCAGRLTGIPISIKDNICTSGIPTTCASKMLENFIPPYNATVIDKLEAAGAVILGKTNMDEFAMGSTTQTSFFKSTKNPYDVQKIPGGSSGGSAASVSNSMVPISLGSDTGGSIRQPASYCGITGIKPTYGSVSRYGLVAFASSLDQIGPLANNAKDCADILNVISGKDHHDSTSEIIDYDFSSKLGNSIKGMRIALPKEFFDVGVADDVKSAVMSAVEYFKLSGAEIIEVSMPSLSYAISAYYLISSSEASSNLARFDGVKYGYRAEGTASYDEMIKKTRAQGFGKEVKRRILLGTYALSSGYYDDYYKKAVQLRAKIKNEYNDIFEKADLIITPTCPTTALRLDETMSDPVKLYLSDICTVTVNIAGLPALSTTCGYDKNGMPIGMSIVGRAFDEPTILGLADNYENQFKRITPSIKK